MAVKTGVNFFVDFHDLNPFTQRQCIYFTKKGTRCRWNCHENARARVLYRRILASNSENLSTENIIEYLLCNCCTYDSAIDPFEKVEHRDWIEDAGLVLPLANRWRTEILARLRATEARTQVTRGSPASSPAPTLLENSPASTPYGASVASTPNRDSITQTPITDPAYYHTRSTPSLERILASPSPQVSPTPAPRAPGIAAIPISFRSQATGKQSPYSEGFSQASAPTNRNSSLEDRYSQPPEFEFRPHKARPSPKDTVSWIMRREPQRRDDESGLIYIFDRDGSPGHVKIGWTAVGIQQRLEDWSKHGYAPRLVFETERIPNAQRVETLTHYELITEWRRELRCRNPECDVKHQEWFEVSPERAKQVVGDWMRFFKKARPYDDLGYLKRQWKGKVDEMDAKGEAVTSAKMLAYHEALFHSPTTNVQNTSLTPPTKFMKQETVMEEPARMESQNLTDITQILQTTLEVFKKESLLAHQEFMKGLRSTQDEHMRDLRSTHDKFLERLKSIELTVQEPATLKPEVETAKSTAPKRRIKVRIPKPKEECVVSSKEESTLPALPDSKSLSELRRKGPTSSAATTIPVDYSLSRNGVAQDEKSTAEAEPHPTKPVSEGCTNSEATRTPNFKLMNNGRMSPKYAFRSGSRESSTSNRFSSGGSLFAKEAHDSNEILSAKSSPFKPLPLFGPPGTYESNHTPFGPILTPESKMLFGTGTELAQGKTLFSGAASTGTKGLTGESTKSTFLSGTKATTEGISLFATKKTPAEGTSLFGTRITSTQSSLFDANATSTGSRLFDTKAASTSLFGATATSTGGSLFGTKAASAGGSVLGSKSTSESSLFGNKASSTLGSLFGTSTTTAQGSLFGSEAPYFGSSIFGIKATSTSSESSSFNETTSAFATGSLFPPTAPSTSTQSSLFGIEATLAKSTSLLDTRTVSTAPFDFGFKATTSTPTRTEPLVFSINTSTKSVPDQVSKETLKEPLSTALSQDAVLTSPKIPSIFDSQVKKELDGFKLDVNSKLPIGNYMPAPQQVQSTEAIVDKEATASIAPLEPPSMASVSRTPTCLPLEENDLYEQYVENVEKDKPKEKNFEEQELHDQGLAEQALCEQELNERNLYNRESEEQDPYADDLHKNDSKDQTLDDPDEKEEESLEGSHIDAEKGGEEVVEEGATEDDSLKEESEEEDREEEDASEEDMLEEDVGGGDVGHEVDDRRSVQQARSCKEPAAQSYKEVTIVSNAKSTISEGKSNQGAVFFCEMNAVDETQTLLAPKLNSLKIVEKVNSVASSLLGTKVKASLNVVSAVTSEVLLDTSLV